MNNITREEKIAKIYEKIKADLSHAFNGEDFRPALFIGDVLDWASKNNNIESYGCMECGTDTLKEAPFLNWDNYREPIEIQSEYCIDKIFNLIKD